MMKISILFAFLFSLSASAVETISVSAVGDLMLGTDYPQNALPVEQGRLLLKAATPYLKASDIRFGNFEDTFFDGPPQSDGKAPGPNRWLFRTPIDFVERLTEAGLNVVSLANNHSKDFGRAGIESSKNVLKLAGIQYSSKDGEVAQFQVRSTAVALIATDFYPGSRSVSTPASTLNEIKNLSEQHPIVIVSAHVGAEGGNAQHVRAGTEIFLGENRGDSVGFAHQAIDAGADLVLMHGPHVVRGMELYRNRLIVYSMGNFATAQGIDISGVAGTAPLVRVRMDLEGKFVDGNIVSFVQNRNFGTILDPQQAALTQIRNLSIQDFPQSPLTFQDNGFFNYQE